MDEKIKENLFEIIERFNTAIDLGYSNIDLDNDLDTDLNELIHAHEVESNSLKVILAIVIIKILSNKKIGLKEIKKEIRDIEKKLDNPRHGLMEIKKEIKDIEDKLDNPDHGLMEIKREIKDIELKLDRIVPVSNTLTTGPVVRDVSASSLIVKVLNNTPTPKTVTATVYDITQCPKTVFASQTFTDITSKCAADFIFDKPPVQYEVEFSGIQPGVYTWTSTRTQAQEPPLMSSNLIAANTFRHAELIPQMDP